jgi:hypothetical protein
VACSEGNPAPWGTSQLPFPTFNGYSPSTPAEGVTGPVVYANYGRREDFELLAKMGVEVEGAIVIARYGRLFRGSKADNAHNAGAIALLIYSDPADYAKEGTEPENVYLLRPVFVHSDHSVETDSMKLRFQCQLETRAGIQFLMCLCSNRAVSSLDGRRHGRRQPICISELYGVIFGGAGTRTLAFYLVPECSVAPFSPAQVTHLRPELLQQPMPSDWTRRTVTSTLQRRPVQTRAAARRGARSASCPPSRHIPLATRTLDLS